MTQRVNAIDGWVLQSQTFHQEMRSFKDTLLAQQEKEAEIQEHRHATNKMLLTVLLVLASYIGIALTILGIVFGKAAVEHGWVDPIHVINVSPPENAKQHPLLDSTIPSTIAMHNGMR